MRNLLKAIALAPLLLTSVAQAGIYDWIKGQFSQPAKDYGYWLCTSCSLPPFTEAVATTAPADLNIFIEASNFDIHSDANEPIHRWLPNSSITICDPNGTCMTVYYQTLTALWLPRQPTFPKPSGKTLKQPKTQPQTSNPPPGIARETVPVGGVINYSAPWIVYVPIQAPQPKTPSVTIIQADVLGTTYEGPLADFDIGINNSVGSWLGWDSSWAFGLDGYVPGTLGPGNTPKQK